MAGTTNTALRSVASLEAEVASVAEELYELFANALADSGVDPAVAAEAIDRCYRRVGRIGLVASANGYRAVREACVAFQDRLSSLVAHGGLPTAPQRELLEAWPALLMTCLSEPHDPLAIDALIDLLSSPEWDEPMTSAEATRLRDAFSPPPAPSVPPTDGDTADALSTADEGSPAGYATDGQEAAVEGGEAVGSEAEPASQIGLEPASETGVEQELVPALQLELAEIVRELFADLDAAGDSPVGTSGALQGAAERIELMGMSAAAAGMMGVMDVCMLVQGTLLALAGLVATSDPATETHVDASTREVIEQWSNRLHAYLVAPHDQAMIEALLDAVESLPWADPMGESERAALRDLLATEPAERPGPEVEDRLPTETVDEAVVDASPNAAPEDHAGGDPANGHANAVHALDVTPQAPTGTSGEPGPTAPEPEIDGLSHGTAFDEDVAETSSDIAMTGDAIQVSFGGAAGNEDDESIAPQALTGMSGEPGPTAPEPEIDGLSHGTAFEEDVAETSNNIATTGDAVQVSSADAVGNEDDGSMVSQAPFPDEAELGPALPAPGGHDLGDADPMVGTPLDAPVRDAAAYSGVADDAAEHSVSGVDHAKDGTPLKDFTIGAEALELIELFSVELESCTDRLLDHLARAIDPDADPATRVDAFDEYLAQLEPFVLASESLGLVGLSDALGYLQENLQALRDTGGVPDAVSAMLRQWPATVLGYLQALGSSDSAAPLIALLADGAWPQPLPDSEAAELESRLLRPQLLAEDAAVEPRQSAARAEDISLVLPEDVNPQLLESLLQELPSETAEFTEAISRMLAGGAGLEELDRAQRIAHTLKGSANTVGVVGIATLTHHLEDILLAFSKHQRLPGTALLEVLIDAADVLEMMSEALIGSGTQPDQAQAVLQRVLDWANQIDAAGLPDDDAEPVAATAAQSSTETGADAEDSTQAGTATAPSADQAGAMLRVPASLVDELLRLAGESIILNGQLQDRLQHALRQTEAAREQNSLVQQLVIELEELVDVQGLNSPQARAGLYEKFDALELEQYNELHTVTHRLVEATTDARELTHGVQEQLDGLAGMLDDQGRLNRESQEAVMRTRMVPVQSIVPRLQRSVRQTGRLTGKQALLEVSGTDTLMDSDVLNELADPLMHILRNAVDHGIEPPEARVAAGKEAVGHIYLSFYREGDHIVLRCRDDGAGLDLARIRDIAAARGLLDPDEEPDEEALMRLVWLPGFSTREVTTQTSGRGIGMDAVFARVTELKGALGIESRTGQGCTVELRLPLTLISVHALLVGTRTQVLAVSTRGIEQILHPGDGTLEHEEGRLYYRLGEARYEAHLLETLLHQPINFEGVGETQRPVLLVRGGTGRTSAILVERVAGSQDLVVKQLGRYVPAIAGIEGATILGDGSVAPVLDMAGLVRTTAPDAVTELAGRLMEGQDAKKLPCALVVDDSLSARRSLAQFVQDAGYEVLTARDGLEAIDVIADRAPDILLVDLEMPRMNGLELTAHVRARTDLREVPIIMITSRSTEKHRQQADEAGVDVYLTKPFSEDDLLGHITERLASA